MASQESIEERLERLERAVAELQRVALVGAGAQSRAEPPQATSSSPPAVPASSPWPPARSPAAAAPAPASPAPPARDWLALGNLWLGRVGIALLVLGLAFLYRYAVVRGWLVPELRIGFGGALGATLLAAGMRLRVAKANRAYGLLLLGGGVGVLYLTAYAAFGFYRLVPAGAALLALTVLTLFTVRLAAGKEEALLAQLGAAGAFFAPILVRTDHPSLALFSGYVVLVVAWTGWTALREGWRLLSWTSVAGGAMLLVLARPSAATPLERALLVSAALLTLPGSSVALLWRERVGQALGSGWRRSVPQSSAAQLDLFSSVTLAVLAGLSFVVYAGSSYHVRLMWMGLAAMVEAVMLGACAWAWRDDPRLARALALAAALPLLLGTLALELRAVRGALALEALALLLVGQRWSAHWLREVGHLVFAGVLIAFAAFV
ncbi:MAG TPA: DUF2339 domain-containing protein, partial [Longimicrobiales bacterium]